MVGIVTAGIDKASSINFAIRSEVALRTLESLAGLCDCILIRAPAGVPVFVDGRMVGTGPRLLVPAEARRYQISAVIGGAMKRATLAFPAERVAQLP